MLLGPKMPGMTEPAWRFVERDVHGVARQVREYDPDARLVRQDRTGQLGLARFWRPCAAAESGEWKLARFLFDLRDDTPLDGEPDQRVLECQRAFDAWRSARALREYRRAVARWDAGEDDRRRRETEESLGEIPDEMVHLMRRENGVKNTIFVGEAA